jgi:hypothetical protein
MIILNPALSLKRELQYEIQSPRTSVLSAEQNATLMKEKENQTTTMNNSSVQLYCGTTQTAPRLLEIETANISNHVTRIIDCCRKSAIHHHNPISPEYRRGIAKFK